MDSFTYETSGGFMMKNNAFTLNVGDPHHIIKEFAGMEWELIVVKEHSIPDNDTFLSVGLICNPHAKREGWFADAKLLLKLRHSLSPGGFETISQIDKIVHFSPENVEFAGPFAKRYSEILNNENEYLLGAEFAVQAELAIVKCGGIDVPRVCTFGSVRQGTADTILKVDGKRIAVSSQLLALHSSFFNNLFYGEISDRHKNEEGDEDFDYDLKDVDYDDFVLVLKCRLLQMIYPEKLKPDEDNVHDVLMLADQFNIPEVKRRCDKFIAKTEFMTDVEKMELGVWYDLPATMEEMASFLVDEKRLKEAVASKRFKTLPDDVKMTIMDKRCVALEKRLEALLVLH